MNTPAIAIQQPAVQPNTQPQQSLNGVVNIASNDQGTAQEQAFSEIFKMLTQQNTQQQMGQQALAQLLKKNGEDNSAQLAAQLMAQNPLLAMLLANNEASTQNVEAALAQLTENATGIQGVTPTIQEPIQVSEEASVAQPQMAQVPATTQQAQKVAVTSEFEAIKEQLIDAENPQMQTQAKAEETLVQVQNTLVQQIVQQPIAKPSKNVVQNTNQEEISPLQTQQQKEDFPKVQAMPVAQKQEQPQQLAEKADFETVAQKIKLHTANAQQGSTQQGNEEQGEEKTQATKQPMQSEKQQVASGEQAVQATFEKQLTSIQDVKVENLNVKNQGSQEVIRQAIEGIKENVAKGKEEFVMRLSPEGLGEITVKLVSENGRTTMQLTAQNQSIQRILGAELEALRQAVRPFNVEVKEVNTANQSQLDMNMSSQSNQQQQFQHQASSFFFNQQQGRGNYTPQSHTLYNQTETASDENNIIPQQVKSTTTINLHI